ncbi:MAG: NADH:flavin oxidoreductase [Clostridia bacterium]|nr:NADH:flavin oxidoreductase [Clostridia bacterium]
MFSSFKIRNQVISNRIVRSATADSETYASKSVTEATLKRYSKLAESGIGLIITGDFPTVTPEMLSDSNDRATCYDYEKVRITDIDKIPTVIHAANSETKVYAQLAPANIGSIPSNYPSPWGTEDMHILTESEIHFIVNAFIKTALHLRDEGFDGVQLHAAHGGFLSLFLSPYANYRADHYGGSHENRCRIIAEIVEGIKKECLDFPVIIKINATDYLPGGIDSSNFKAFVTAIINTDIDAIELSGGMWEAMQLSEEALGFPPIPALESRTSIGDISKQSYFRSYARLLKEVYKDIPVILTGGNRTPRLMEEILESGDADFIGLCRPLICEPNLAAKWTINPEYKPKCINCNACIYDLWNHPGSDTFSETRCLYNLQRADPTHKAIYAEAIRWLHAWKSDNIG